MEEKNDRNRIKEYIIWFSSKEKYLSFHAETGCDKAIFPDYAAMWDKVHELVEKGFLVQ